MLTRATTVQHRDDFCSLAKNRADGKSSVELDPRSSADLATGDCLDNLKDMSLLLTLGFCWKDNLDPALGFRELEGVEDDNGAANWHP